MALTMFMYHRILPEEHKEAISCAQFERQLDEIARHYQILSANQAEHYIRGTGTFENGNYAALSFDDGWVDNLLYATPILKRRKLSALLAVSAGYRWEGAVRKSETDAVLYRSMADSQQCAAQGDFSAYLNTSELKTMADSGCWQLEAHGTRHVKGAHGHSILSCPQNGESPQEFEAFLRNDLEQSAAYLTTLTGMRPTMLFWPWGHYSTAALEIAQKAGFSIQFTVEKGTIRRSDRRMVLPRVGVSPRWKKFRRNALVFRHPLLAFLHGFFHKEQVCFDGELS